MALGIPHHVTPMQWHQALEISRQACAGVFRDGGTARDAVRPYADVCEPCDMTWERAVDIIAHAMCERTIAKAA